MISGGKVRRLQPCIVENERCWQDEAKVVGRGGGIQFEIRMRIHVDG